MIIKGQHEKLEQAKDEVIKLRDELKNNDITHIDDAVLRLDNLLNLLFDNDLYIPSK
jgi:hypothetical protein